MRQAVRLTEQDDAFASVDTHADLIRALRELNPRQRAAVVLTQLRGYSSEEAAATLERTPPPGMLTSRAKTSIRRTAGGAS